jgi:hypothetical protein
MRRALATSGPATVQFYEALALGVVLLSPRLLTLVVATRDAANRRQRHTPLAVGPESAAVR